MIANTLTSFFSGLLAIFVFGAMVTAIVSCGLASAGEDARRRSRSANPDESDEHVTDNGATAKQDRGAPPRKDGLPSGNGLNLPDVSTGRI